MGNAVERQLTTACCGHILTNTAVWSPDGQWIVYDLRSDPAGSVFDGTRIEAVHVETAEVQVLYESDNGAHCGVATWHPREAKVVFILGPDHPTSAYQYGPARRRGVIVDTVTREVTNLDARDLTPPFTPGALRGGSHVHVFSPDGERISFTYDDDVLDARGLNRRNVAVAIPRTVQVPHTHPRNHAGAFFSTVVTRTSIAPLPGSDEISRAFEEAWVGEAGYMRPDGTRQNAALAFQGTVLAEGGQPHSEVFIVDLPQDLTRPGEGPLQGTENDMPFPPAGVRQRRLTFTDHRRHPGIQGPRHWLRSCPDGSRIAFLMNDDAGIVQIFTVSPNGGEPLQLTHNPASIASAFTWSPDGSLIAHVMDNSVCLTDVASGRTCCVTERSDDATAPRPEAVVFSPDGRQIAYFRRVAGEGGVFNQIFCATI